MAVPRAPHQQPRQDVGEGTAGGITEGTGLEGNSRRDIKSWPSIEAGGFPTVSDHLSINCCTALADRDSCCWHLGTTGSKQIHHTMLQLPNLRSLLHEERCRQGL